MPVSGYSALPYIPNYSATRIFWHVAEIGKVIKSGVRQMVLNVKELFMKEKQFDAPIIPFERVMNESPLQQVHPYKVTQVPKDPCSTKTMKVEAGESSTTAEARPPRRTRKNLGPSSYTIEEITINGNRLKRSLEKANQNAMEINLMTEYIKRHTDSAMMWQICENQKNRMKAITLRLKQKVIRTHLAVLRIKDAAEAAEQNAAEAASSAALNTVEVADSAEQNTVKVAGSAEQNTAEVAGSAAQNTAEVAGSAAQNTVNVAGSSAQNTVAGAGAEDSDISSSDDEIDFN